MAKKVITGQPERPNSGVVAARNPMVEPCDTHIQRVADVQLLTAEEVASVPVIQELVLNSGCLVDPSEGGLTGLTLPVSSYPDGTLLQREGTSLVGRMVTGFAAKATPTEADSILIGDAANSGNYKSTTLAAAVALAPRSSPYLRKPASPNAFDDEFESGSPDLAVRGYTVINSSTGVAQTRNGNLDVWGSPPAGTYNSQLIDSWLFIQAPAGVQLDVYKAVTLAAGDTYYARSTGSYNLSTAAVGRFNEIGFYGASGALLDNNNRVYTTVQDDPSTFYLYVVAGRVTATVFAGVSRLMLAGHDIRGVFYDTGTTFVPFVLDSQNGEPSAINSTGCPAAATLTRFALRNLFSSSGSAGVPQIWGLDFIRKKTSRAWLIP